MPTAPTGKPLTTQMEIITPEVAARYLATNTKNRTLRKRWVNELARMMTAGDWKVTHQGIAFDGDGSLKDGQHRLTAVVQSGVTVAMMVTRGITDAAMLMIDTAARRSDADAMQIDGWDVDSQMVAIGRAMMGNTGSENTRYTRPEVIAFVQKHIDAIRFATLGIKTGLKNANVRAPIARAWYGCNRERLVEFMKCINTGLMVSADDTAAIMLRNFMMLPGKASKIVIYRKAESALFAFLERRPIAKLYEAGTELFPLPDEDLPADLDDDEDATPEAVDGPTEHDPTPEEIAAMASEIRRKGWAKELGKQRSAKKKLPKVKEAV